MNNQVSFDSLLRMAVRETYLEQVNAIPSEDEIEKILKPSSEFKRKIKAIVSKENRNEKLAQIRRTSGKVAVVIMMCISLTFASLMAAEAVRESVATTILEWHDKFTRIFIETDTQPEKLPEIRFNYIPEGFELVEEKSWVEDEYQMFLYEDVNSSFIRIFISPGKIDNSFYLDNEQSNIYLIRIDNKDCLWKCTEYENRLMISYDNKLYNITSTESIEEIIKIYKNIEIL